MAELEQELIKARLDAEKKKAEREKMKAGRS
jgi:hypothetical protein